MLLPLHTVGLFTLAVTFGSGFTLTDVAAVFVPQALVPVTV